MIKKARFEELVQALRNAIRSHSHLVNQSGLRRLSGIFAKCVTVERPLLKFAERVLGDFRDDEFGLRLSRSQQP